MAKWENRMHRQIRKKILKFFLKNLIMKTDDSTENYMEKMESLSETCS